jgi:hypothetical protein
MRHERGRAVVVVRRVSVIRSLQRLFVFRGHHDVETMLEDSPQLVPLLIEAHKEVGRIFGKNALLILEVVRNPEARDDSPEIVLYIETVLPVQAAMEQLARLDDEWWLDRVARGEGRLNIALEYV